MNWHSKNIPEVFDLLGTNQQGLSAADADKKLLEVGPNELKEGKKKSIAGMLLSQFKDHIRHHWRTY
jgi:Ca2+-transporting ATPase